MSMTLQQSALYQALRLFQPRGISPLVVGLACLLVPAPLLATELLVPETYKTIQAALDVAVSGDVVSVAARRASPRVYHENVRFTSHGVTLRSRIRHGATIEGDGTEHVVTFNPYSGTVEGFVITGSGQNRSGVFTSQAQQVIRHNLITGNYHGITISSNSVALIEANHIVDNGPLYLTSGIRVMGGASGTIVNNLIAGSGVGIWVGTHAGGIDIVNNTFVDNANFGMVFGLESLAGKISNNIVTGSEYGIYASGEFSFDPSGYVGQFLVIDHNLFWANSLWDYYASLGGFTPDGLDQELTYAGAVRPPTGYRRDLFGPAARPADRIRSLGGFHRDRRR
jgi:nitrous oxidase accessory protein NosD